TAMISRSERVCADKDARQAPTLRSSFRAGTNTLTDLDARGDGASLAPSLARGCDRHRAAEAPAGGPEEQRGGERQPRDHAGDYRPTNRGRRFSRNAAVPSL